MASLLQLGRIKTTLMQFDKNIVILMWNLFAALNLILTYIGTSGAAKSVDRGTLTKHSFSDLSRTPYVKRSVDVRSR